MEWPDEEAAEESTRRGPRQRWVVWSGARPKGGPIARTAAKAGGCLSAMAPIDGSQQTIQLSFLCSCGSRIVLKSLGCCRSCYDRRHHSLRFFGGMRERVLVRDRFRCRGCGKRSALVVHHRDRHNRTNSLVTLCIRCHIRIHRSSGLKYWFSEILVRLWHELHPNAPIQVQLSFQNVDKKKNSRGLFKQTTGETLSFSSLPDARALELSGILDHRPESNIALIRSQRFDHQSARDGTIHRGLGSTQPKD